MEASPLLFPKYENGNDLSTLKYRVSFGKKLPLLLNNLACEGYCSGCYQEVPGRESGGYYDAG
jgi:hypothetical protein